MLSLLATLVASGEIATAVTVYDSAGVVAGATVTAECSSSQAASGRDVVSVVSDDTGTATVKLGPGKCRIRAMGQGRTSWSVPVSLTGEPVRVDLLPAGQVTGVLTGLGDASGQSSIGVRLTPARGAQSWLAKPEKEDVLACKISERRWTCTVPADTDLDLELSFEGWAPNYVRGVRVSPGDKYESGTQRFFAGASIAGWIVDSSSRASRVRNSVEATARTRSSGGPSITVVEADRRGFFQIGPLEEGTYELRARTESGASLATPVRVERDKEARLVSPLIARPTAPIRVNINPPEDPDGKPWLVRLIAARGPQAATIEADEAAGAEGRWSRDAVPLGPYNLAIRRADGSVWYREQFELEGAGCDFDIAPGQTRVTGSIRSGSRPLSTDLALRERTSGVEVEMTSDSDGVFEGWLPRQELISAEWSLRIRERASGLRAFYEGIAPDQASPEEVHFTLVIPGNTIEGTVTDENRTPKQASVLAQSIEPGAPGKLRSTLPAQALSSSETGEFAIRGLPAGKYAVFAMIPGDHDGMAIESNAETVVVDHDGETPKRVRLVLRQSGTIPGRVTTADGVGVAGATVYAKASHAPYAPVPVLRSDGDGRFVTSVPAATPSVDAVVEAVGVGRLATRRAVPPGGALDLRLDPGATGTLAVTVAAPVDLRMVSVYREGVPDSWVDLARWAQWHGAIASAGELRVPLMAPGSYRVCRSGSVAEDLEAAADPLPARCAEGVLVPAGELHLVVPVPGKSAP